MTVMHLVSLQHSEFDGVISGRQTSIVRPHVHYREFQCGDVVTLHEYYGGRRGVRVAQRLVTAVHITGMPIRVRLDLGDLPDEEAIGKMECEGWWERKTLDNAPNKR